jgi:hypothetical protein
LILSALGGVRVREMKEPGLLSCMYHAAPLSDSDRRGRGKKGYDARVLCSRMKMLQGDPGSAYYKQYLKV